MSKTCARYGCNEPVYYEGATLCEAHIRQQNASLRIEGDNFIGRILSYIGAGMMAAGFILSIVFGIREGFGTFVLVLISGIASGMLFVGMGEIIRLLQKISDK